MCEWGDKLNSCQFDRRRHVELVLLLLLVGEQLFAALQFHDK